VVNLFDFKQIKQIDHFRKHATIQQRATALEMSVEVNTQHRFAGLNKIRKYLNNLYSSSTKQ